MRRTAKSLLANCPEAISKGTARDQVGEAVGVSGQMIDHHRRRLVELDGGLAAITKRDHHREEPAAGKEAGGFFSRAPDGAANLRPPSKPRIAQTCRFGRKTGVFHG